MDRRSCRPEDRARRWDESPVAFGLATRRFSAARGVFWIGEYKRDPAATTRAIEAMRPAPVEAALHSTDADVQAVEQMLAAAEDDRPDPEVPRLMYPPTPDEADRALEARARDVAQLSDAELQRLLFGGG